MTTVTQPPKTIHSMGKTQHWMLRAIEWYQGQREGAVSPCRFFPTCSSYAHEAVSEHGPWRGGWMTARRLIRCRPFGPSGYDPVPLAADCCDENTTHPHKKG
ncbi:MAG: hypothetical protein RIR87_457 [Actinomycetota bacterium]